MTTHYDVLGVDEDATLGEIKRAYYSKARVFHPDAHAGSSGALLEEAERAMQSLNVAWNVLRNAKTRDTYDRLLEARKRSQAAQERGRAAAGPRRRGRAGQPPPRLMIGGGFKYWLGSSGAAGRSANGRTRLNLSVEGRTSLEPLRVLAPNGLWGLHAERSSIGDTELIHLQGMTGLQLLDLSGTRVTDAGLVHLQGLSNLDTLFLWNTAITDTGLVLLGKLTSLRQLGLGNTRITDRGLAHLRSLTALRLLQLWGTEVKGPGLDHLHVLPELETVTLPWRVRGRHRRRLKAAHPRLLIA